MAPAARRPRNRPPRVRKRNRDIQALPADDAEADADAQAVAADGADPVDDSTKSRKRKRDDAVARPPKNKPRGQRRETANASAGDQEQEKEHEDGEQGQEDGHAKAAATPKKNDRFIVFVGNLPYSTTQATLSAHFAPVKPSSIRLATHKPTTPSRPDAAETCKGYAFVEFADAPRMKSCLSLFHHSLFEGRKINVELTAGGGGKSDGRQAKVRAKNEKLNAQRKRRFEEELKKKRETQKDSNDGEAEKKVEVDEDEAHLHPSRRKRVKR